jgi:hypothetical protein
MDDRETPPPDKAKEPAAPRSARAGREERLAAALRENLRRRKAQARARAAEAPPRADKPPEG